MRVALVHRHDSGPGGGNVAMLRLHRALRATGISSTIICRSRRSLPPDEAVEIPATKSSEIASLVVRKLSRQIGMTDIDGFGAFLIGRMEAFKRADVVDFHCIHHDFFSYPALASLSRKKRCVLTLHDMWPFTGGCYNSLECGRWRTGCGSCPHLDLIPRAERDGTRLGWLLKKITYAFSDVSVVAPSQWMCGMVEQSLLKPFPIHLIRHGIDLSVFHPVDREEARRDLGIPLNRKVIAVSAANLADRLKGGDLLVQAVGMLPPGLKSELQVIIIGRGGGALAAQIEAPSLELGYMEHDEVVSKVYSASELLVHPSRIENASLVILEAIACGTPVVAFDVGGNAECVRHLQTGYLARPENPRDLATGIETLLSDRNGLERMAACCRATAEKEHSLEEYVARYRAVYSGAVSGGPTQELARGV